MVKNVGAFSCSQLACLSILLQTCSDTFLFDPLSPFWPPQHTWRSIVLSCMACPMLHGMALLHGMAPLLGMPQQAFWLDSNTSSVDATRACGQLIASRSAHKDAWSATSHAG